MPFLPFASGFIGAKKKGRPKKRTITMKQSFFSVRPFGKKRAYPWKGRGKTIWDKISDTTMEVTMRPFVLQAEYAPSINLHPKDVKKMKFQQKLEERPRQFDYLWKKSALARAMVAGAGTTGLIFAPNPAFGALGGVAGGFWAYTKTPFSKKVKQDYQRMMKQKYKVPIKGFWKY